MIATITGSLAQSGLDWAIINVGGVGIRLAVPPNVVTHLATTTPNGQVTLATTLIVREDSLTLYGFSSDQERDTFEVLLTVSGIGPRTALAALSVLSPDQLSDAIDQSDFKVLQRVPGIGKKSAQRLVLELTGKLDVSAPTASPSHPTKGDTLRGEVEAALEQLGWSKAVASRTLDELPGENRDASSLLRAALIHLGGGGRA